MKTFKILSVRATEADLQIIQAERERLGAQGIDLSLSAAVRGLLQRGASVTELVGTPSMKEHR